MGSTGIEPGPPEWKATALTTALAWSAINFTKIIEFIKYSQNGGIFIVLVADQARAVVNVVAFHSGGPGSIPVETYTIFSFDSQKSHVGLLIW